MRGLLFFHKTQSEMTAIETTRAGLLRSWRPANVYLPHSSLRMVTPRLRRILDTENTDDTVKKETIQAPQTTARFFIPPRALR